MAKIDPIEEGVEPEGGEDQAEEMAKQADDFEENLAVAEERAAADVARLEILRESVDAMKKVLKDSHLPDEAKVARLRAGMADARRRVTEVPGGVSDESRLAELFKAKVVEVKEAMRDPSTTEAKLADAVKMKVAEVREVMADPERKAKIFGKSCSRGVLTLNSLSNFMLFLALILRLICRRRWRNRATVEDQNGLASHLLLADRGSGRHQDRGGREE